MCETNHQRIYVLKTLTPSPSEDLEVQRQRLLSAKRLAKTGNVAVAPGKVLMKCDNCGADLWRYPSQCLNHVYCPKCRHQDFLKSFWSKIDKTSSPHGCWIWTGKTDDGYGAINHNGFRRAHRLTWFLLRGEIPHGKFVLHRCPGGSNRACCNPDHCYLGSKRDNSLDMVREGTTYAARGEDNYNAELTASAVLYIREHYVKSQKGCTKKLAEMFHVKPGTILDVVTRSWQWLAPTPPPNPQQVESM